MILYFYKIHFPISIVYLKRTIKVSNWSCIIITLYYASMQYEVDNKSTNIGI